MSKFFRFWLFEVTLPLAILGCAVFAFRMFGEAESKKRAPVGGSPEARLRLLPAAEIEPCESLAMTNGLLDIRANGTVVPAREIQQGAEVSGQIVFKSPKCDAGQYVQKGELLIRIDTTDYELEIERLNKVVIQEEESLRELAQEFENTKKLVELAAEELILQDKELKRLGSLPEGFASETELDRVRTTRLQTLNRQTQATNQQELLAKRQARLQASLMLAQTQLKRAQKDLERTEIRAAADGMIVQDNAEMSTFVQRGTIVVTLEEAGRMEIATDLRMDQLYWILKQSKEEPVLQSRQSELVSAPSRQTGYELPHTPTTVQFKVAGREHEMLTWEGHLERYEGIGIDPQTRMIPVRVVVKDPRRSDQAADSGPSLLMRGMFVELIIHTKPQTPLVLIPSLAMRPGSRVWKFVPNPEVLKRPLPGESATVELTPPTPKAETHDHGLEIRSEDWLAGELVVIESLRPVTEIRIDPDPQTQPPAKAKSYWICETEGQLLPGDPVIITPLAGIVADGSDAVRVPLQGSLRAPQAATYDRP